MAVTTVVAGRAHRAQIRKGLGAALAPLHDMINNQPTTRAAIRRRAIRGCASAMISCESYVSKLPPGLGTVIGFVNLQAFVRCRLPTRGTVDWWSNRHNNHSVFC